MLPKSVSPGLLPAKYPTETGGFYLMSNKSDFSIHFTTIGRENWDRKS